jgi:hypothetical protein
MPRVKRDHEFAAGVRNAVALDVRTKSEHRRLLAGRFIHFAENDHASAMDSKGARSFSDSSAGSSNPLVKNSSRMAGMSAERCASAN